MTEKERQRLIMRAILGRRRQEAMRAHARAELEKVARVHGGARMSRGYFPDRGPTSGVPGQVKQMRPGQFEVQYGMIPSDSDVSRFMAATGTSQGVSPGQAMAVRAQRAAVGEQAQLAQRQAGIQGVPAMGGAGGMAGGMAGGATAEVNPLADFVAQQQAEAERARQENLKRYDEGKGELTTLRQRNQDRVGNWGVAAQQDIDERLAETSSKLRADAAARGLANSNVPGAIIQRAARDTAREQQRVSEMRDDRLARYDTGDTGNLVGFIERRNDVGPDPNLTAQLAMQMAQQGLAEKELASQEKRDLLRIALEERRRKDQRRGYGGLGGGYFGGGYRGGMRQRGGPIMLGPPNVAGLLGLGPMSSQIVSNRYPTTASRRDVDVAPARARRVANRRAGKGPKILSKPPVPPALRQRYGPIELPMYV